jgi:YggT family protein
MLNELVYPVAQGMVVFLLTALTFVMVARMIFNYADPNPFGALGRFSYKLKKSTDSLVWPAATILARMRVGTKIAPLITILIGCVAGYFLLQIVWEVLGTIDGVGQGVADFSITKIIGHLLFGLLSIYTLMIVVRIIFSWVSESGNRFTRFLARFTDPLLNPFRRMIPPLGMFDLSPIVVLLLLNLLRAAVAGVFLR